ncbi:MAG: hypothetical protein J6J36_08105 [Clostridia bacterium]|nr:hypothetical protein [Clostridia bacterium]MBP3708536.1 hypothetical protein [Clostridia bacterium]
MAFTKEEIEQVKTAVEQKLETIEEWKIEEIEEPIFVEQIEEGEIEKENFYEAITSMGLPYKKKGRIPFEQVEVIAPEILNFFKDSVNPRADIKDVLNMKTTKGVEKINKRINKTKKIRERDKVNKIARNKKIHDELVSLEESNVNINKSLMWSFYIIMRGEKRLERFEEDGKDIDLLKLQNSFLTDENIEDLKELRTEYYEE